MRSMPSKIDKSKRSEAQKMHLSKFYTHGTIYWRMVKNTPELFEAYKALAVSPVNAYNLAMKDFMSKPEIKDIRLDLNSSGHMPVIQILATDVIGVQLVEVSVMLPDGNVLLSGPANRKGRSDLWLFACSPLDPSLREIRVKITAYDYPDNSTIAERIFPISS